ncbi:phosphate signaling complex protein PhoU [Staphylococcus chromogenes]|nr:phosphate signaling complex protein PhoU [Staphylococcus chromogenes]
MRTAYRENLDEFAFDLTQLCGRVRDAMKMATIALLEQDLQLAEDCLSTADELEEMREHCEQQAVGLLALEGPLARDLRQVVSSIYIVDELNRMGALAIHIARAARRRHPSGAVPEPIVPYFKELSRLTLDMLDKVHALLRDPDADVAMVLVSDDDAVDDLHDHLMLMLTRREWPHSTVEAVDVALLSRFFERFADHTVNMAARIVYLATGLTPTEYSERRRADDLDSDWARRFAEIEKRFS